MLHGTQRVDTVQDKRYWYKQSVFVGVGTCGVQKTKAVDEILTERAMDVGDCISVVAKKERVLSSSYYNVSIMIAFNDEPKANKLISLER